MSLFKFAALLELVWIFVQKSAVQNDQNSKWKKGKCSCYTEAWTRRWTAKTVRNLRSPLNRERRKAQTSFMTVKLLDTFHYKTSSNVNNESLLIKRKKKPIDQRKWACGTENLHILCCLCHPNKDVFNLPLVESFNWVNMN